MSRQRKSPLRGLTKEERQFLVHLQRTATAPASQVARAKGLLAVADGHRHVKAVQAAVIPRHGGGRPPLGLAMWCEDEAGPYQAIPQPGQSWAPLGQPACHPHEYVRGGMAKLLTLFHPATGRMRVRAVPGARIRFCIPGSRPHYPP